MAACRSDKNKFSEVPFIRLNYVSVYNNGFGKDSFILFNFHYQDGDGDIGLDPGDSAPPFGYGQPFFYNMPVTLLQYKNKSWKQVPNPFNPVDSIHFNERIPVITPKGKYKWIEGDLELKIPAQPLGVLLDTIKLQVQLFDRARHKSNVLESETLILQH